MMSWIITEKIIGFLVIIVILIVYFVSAIMVMTELQIRRKYYVSLLSKR